MGRRHKTLGPPVRDSVLANWRPTQRGWTTSLGRPVLQVSEKLRRKRMAIGRRGGPSRLLACWSRPSGRWMIYRRRT
jgi:hypothetical protein